MSAADQTPGDNEGFAAWLCERVGRGAMPRWLDTERLPPLRWADGQAVPPPAREAAVALLRRHKSRDDRESLDALGSRLARRSAAEFAWGLFSLWNEGGGHGRDKWALLALGEWGDGETAARLARFIRDWPSQRKFQRAAQGLEILKQIGADAALAQIDSIATQAKSAALRERARLLLEEAALERGLSRDELADRIVPTCGFSPAGELRLDFGPRAFTAKLQPDLSLRFLDPSGKVRKTPPRAGKSDDPEAARIATETIKSAKRQLKDLQSLLPARLENAMIARRRWPAADWKDCFLAHPILRLLVPRLVWATFDRSGAVASSFRVAEDWSLADVADEPFPLPESAWVGAPHPLQLGSDLIGRWTAVFADYEIVPLFEQLGRATFTPGADEIDDNQVSRYIGHMVDGRRLLQQLARSGWSAGAPREFGSVFVHSRAFEHAELTAMLHHTALFLGFYESAPEAALKELVFVRGARVKVDGWGEAPSGRLAVGDVDRIVFSEAVRDVDRLAKTGLGFDPNWERKTQAFGL